MSQVPEPEAVTFVHNKKRPSSLWTRGVYYEGLTALYDIDPQQQYIEYINRWANHHKWTPRNGVTTTNADDQCCEQTYIWRYRQTKNYELLTPTLENLNKQMLTDKKNYWWWIDAIQMAMPIYAQVAKSTGKRQYMDYAMEQYRYTRDKEGGGLFNKKTGLWWRDKNFVPPYKESDGKDCYWSRGNGWVYAALVRCMIELSPDDPYYKELKNDFLLMSKALIKCQREDGLWNASLVSTSWEGKELTGTSLFLYGMAWGVRNGLLKAKTYLPIMERAWAAMVNDCVHANGFLGFVQGTGAGPADGQPVTYDRAPDFEDYGTGCFLLGATEYYKLLAPASSSPISQSSWPDGTPIDTWFQNTTKINIESLGKQYVLTDYNVKPSSAIQTKEIQNVIDSCAKAGGGVIVIPRGTFHTGALFFHQGTHLHLSAGAVLKGSERIADFPILTTRIEGETCKYFSALINADSLNGFTISGPGTIDGNGLHYWQEFWMRRTWNPQCTNKDAQRPRLTYISNSKNVTIQDVRLINSPFWTNHVYKSNHVRFLDCYIYAPTENIWEHNPKRGAPSSDAIDIDACTDVLINGCYMHVNDDAVVLKGGKGTWADKDPANGPCERIIIQNCRYGKVHGCLTLGSESLHDRNIIVRNCFTERADRVLWLKLRPDTPQHYEYIQVENIYGRCKRFLFIHPWSQFFKMEQRDDMPMSRCNNITLRNINVEAQTPYDVVTSDKYELTDFTIDGRPLEFATNPEKKESHKNIIYE